MIFAGLSVDVLLETGKTSERFDASVFKIELTFGDVSGVIGNGVRYVVAGHGGNSKNGNRTCVIKVNRLFVAGGKLAVKVAGITAV